MHGVSSMRLVFLCMCILGFLCGCAFLSCVLLLSPTFIKCNCLLIYCIVLYVMVDDPADVSYDSYARVRTLNDQLMERSKAIFYPGEHMAVDESSVYVLLKCILRQLVCVNVC